MDEFTQLRQDFNALKQEFNLFKQQDLSLDKVSDVTDDLGTMRAGQFLALSSGSEPTDPDACGSFKSALGETFDGEVFHDGGVNNGQLQWGASAVDGSIVASAGLLRINRTGINVQGLGYPFIHTGTIGINTRIGRLLMFDPGSGIPAWVMNYDIYTLSGTELAYPIYYLGSGESANWLSLKLYPSYESGNKVSLYTHNSTNSYNLSFMTDLFSVMFPVVDYTPFFATADVNGSSVWSKSSTHGYSAKAVLTSTGVQRSTLTAKYLYPCAPGDVVNPETNVWCEAANPYSKAGLAIIFYDSSYNPIGSPYECTTSVTGSWQDVIGTPQTAPTGTAFVGIAFVGYSSASGQTCTYFYYLTNNYFITMTPALPNWSQAEYISYPAPVTAGTVYTVTSNIVSLLTTWNILVRWMDSNLHWISDSPAITCAVGGQSARLTAPVGAAYASVVYSGSNLDARSSQIDIGSISLQSTAITTSYAGFTPNFTVALSPVQLQFISAPSNPPTGFASLYLNVIDYALHKRYPSGSDFVVEPSRQIYPPPACTATLVSTTIVYNGAGTGTYAASGTITPPLPASWLVGDLLICVIDDRNVDTLSFPVGWTKLVDHVGTASSAVMTVAYKIAQAGETAPAISGSTGNIGAQIVAYTGVNPSAPISVTTTPVVTGTSVTITANGLTTLVNNEALIFAGVSRGSGSVTALSGAPTPTKRIDFSSGSSVEAFLADSIIATAGTATGTRTATDNASGVNVGFQFSLAPLPMPGNLEQEAHTYYVTFTDVGGETNLGAASNTVTTDAAHLQNSLSNIPIGPGPWGTFSRKVYRASPSINSGVPTLLTTINDNSTTTYNDNTAGSSLNPNYKMLVSSTLNTTVSRPIFPRMITFQADELLYSVAATRTISTSAILGFYQSITPTNGAVASWAGLLDAGTYAMHIVGQKAAGLGMTDFYVDGTLVQAGIDWYAGSTTWNVQVDITGIALAAGYHLFQLVINGKNGSSSAYGLNLSKVFASPNNY
ncbi:MAG: hypothetical protein P4L50_03235 [Anaerolineaceae bacterium]|nr:hypothetical protein [Anaerolineaceae bacterium]